MADVEFTDNSAKVTGALQKVCATYLEEAAIELEAETQRQTPTKETQLKGSWTHDVEAEALQASVGSPLESALWNEFGTGSYAEHGDGRKGWWVYVEGQGVSTRVSKTYASEEEAMETVNFLRAKGLDAHPSNGKPKQMTLRNAFAAKKNALIKRATELIGGTWE